MWGYKAPENEVLGQCVPIQCRSPGSLKNFLTGCDKFAEFALHATVKEQEANQLIEQFKLRLPLCSFL